MFFCVSYCSMSSSSCDIMTASPVKTADVLSRHYWPVWVWSQRKIQPFRGGSIGFWVWSKGEIHPFKQIAHTSYFRHQIPSDTLNCLFPSNTFLPRTYYFFQISQPTKICLKNRYFEEQFHWVPLTYLPTYILIPVVLQLYRMLKEECQLKYILQDIGLHTYKFTTA